MKICDEENLGNGDGWNRVEDKALITNHKILFPGIIFSIKLNAYWIQHYLNFIIVTKSLRIDLNMHLKFIDSPTYHSFSNSHSKILSSNKFFWIYLEYWQILM